MKYSVRLNGDLYDIRMRANDEIAMIGDVPLSGLEPRAAGEYLYALLLVETARNPGHSHIIKRAVERSIRRDEKSVTRHLLDLIASVKWMMPDIAIPDEVLLILVRKFAAELDVILVE